MNIRLRSAVSRREAIRSGLIAYLGAGVARGELTAETAVSPPVTAKPIPSTGESLPIIGPGTESFRRDESEAAD